MEDWDALVAGVRGGDAAALRRFVERYAPAIERFADRAIEPRLRRRFGAESVAQSVCRTFLRRAGDGQFSVTDPGSLWALLAAIALTKVRERRRFHLRQRRRVDREDAVPADDAGGAALADPEPSPEDVAAFDETFEMLVGSLDEEERRILERRLEGRAPNEIAAELGCSGRTVRRRLGEMETRLRSMLGG